MSSPVLARLFPTVTRAASRAVTKSHPSRISSSSQWTHFSRRPFSSRSALFVKKYTEDHEWIELDADGKTGTIGITEYAAKALGDVVYVELPEIGMEVSKGDTIGAVESVKSASDILTPVSGKITDHNKVLEEKPATINKSPEADGWLAKIEVSDAAELDSLMSKEDYDNFEKE
ncbi:glycine cleavage system H-protein subunit [Exophiala dermatitidis]|uniref:Glycine cleavage system H protein n=1 Tax=Exophiala dermatitidis TaxID=5970 RepID=A0AAN6IR99_EXODE|nr:glycine cleavage system H-protein subunit [Exophiala dermatitidis]KAJ4507238.1 glycine cleavage system H-protein subunit [Exophiala dermatitidis]KAJ4517287.1 glycine cleavage system H-protein subunit [Exophiala dermatitidis]KAJ4548967.1 glycine cleavage system H-protein subunit [Exophiala dermatitidis]KAJ4550739.1 glycine cleavage system H-protein subunit [Exophiala dermatitidis]